MKLRKNKAGLWIDEKGHFVSKETIKEYLSKSKSSENADDNKKDKDFEKLLLTNAIISIAKLDMKLLNNYIKLTENCESEEDEESTDIYSEIKQEIENILNIL